MAGRGGRRLNAGRKLKLDVYQRLSVGAECERLQNEMVKRRKELLENDAHDFTNLPEWWDWIQSIPVNERAAFTETQDFKDHAKDVAKELTKVPPLEKASKYGTRRRVVANVAKWATLRFAVPILPSFVEDCWEEFRALA